MSTPDVLAAFRNARLGQARVSASRAGSTPGRQSLAPRLRAHSGGGDTPLCNTLRPI